MTMSSASAKSIEALKKGDYEDVVVEHLLNACKTKGIKVSGKKKRDEYIASLKAAEDRAPEEVTTVTTLCLRAPGADEVTGGHAERIQAHQQLATCLRLARLPACRGAGALRGLPLAGLRCTSRHVRRGDGDDSPRSQRQTCMNQLRAAPPIHFR